MPAKVEEEIGIELAPLRTQLASMQNVLNQLSIKWPTGQRYEFRSKSTAVESALTANAII